MIAERDSYGSLMAFLFFSFLFLKMPLAWVGCPEKCKKCI